ncbi:MAG: right-handed parallel beta-helix repeat-containing protein, partial [Elusimicrobiota bacterium]
MITAGSAVSAYFTGSTQIEFDFNDVNSTGTGLSTAYLLQLAGSTAAAKNNIFLSSWTVTVASASLFMDLTSGIDSDYNDWFSSNALNTFIWNNKSYATLAAWQAVGGDANSISANPLWYDARFGVEDFHPMSAVSNGRWANGSMSASDGANSPTIDSADPLELYGNETAPNGGRANQGSYGNTDQASRSLATYCAVQRNVSKTSGPYFKIQDALDSIPKNLTGHTCVIIKDNATYPEQVTVQGFTNNNSSITIMLEPILTAHPTVAPPTASTAAFQIMQTSVNIFNIDVKPTLSVAYGVLASSALISISSMNVDAGGNIWTAGVRLSSWNYLNYSSITVQDAHGIYLEGSTMTTVAYSTAQANSATKYALYLNNASSNTFNVSVASNPAGVGAKLNYSHYNNLTQSFFNGDAARAAQIAYGNYNYIAFSTFNANTMATAVAALELTGASNTITNIFARGHRFGVYFGGSYDKVDLSTVASGGGAGAVSFQGAPGYNTLTRSLITNQNHMGLDLRSSNNAISLSTITTNSSSYGAVTIDAASSNTITLSYISNANDNNGVALKNNAHYNNISWSTITTSGASSAALDITLSSYVAITRSYLSNPNYYAAYLKAGANYAAIRFSTITSDIAGYSALYLYQNYSNTISNSYIQGSTAVYVNGSTGTVLGANMIVATNTIGVGVRLSGNSLDLYLASNTIQSGPRGMGVFLAAGNQGRMVVSTNIINAGAQYGLYVMNQTAGAQVWVTSNTISPTISNARDTYGIYLNSLISGATIYNNGIYHRSAGNNSGQTVYGLYASNSSGINFDHNRLNQPGMITGGGAVSAYFTGSTAVDFSFNDVNSTGSLGTAYLLQLDNSTVTVKNNIFLSSWTVSVASAAVNISANSGLDSNYNDWFSSNSLHTFVWANTYQTLPGWQAAGKDANSIAANPYWQDPRANFEDFHVKSQYLNGRYNPATNAFDQTDAATSLTIDAADPGEAVTSYVLLPPTYAGEPAPNGSRANQGSYGQTAQATRLGATARVWTGLSGDNRWYTAGNWNPVGIPLSVDDLTIDVNGASVTVAASSPSISFAALALGDVAGTNRVSLSIATTVMTLGGSLTMYNKSTFLSSSTDQNVLGSLTMYNGSTMTHAANTTSRSSVLNLKVNGNFDFPSGASINLAARGYAGGAGSSGDASPGYGPAGSGGGGKTGSTSNAGGGGGHAGRGGVGGGPGGGTGGAASDSLTAPTELGSGGGGGYTGQTGGAGGGAAIIYVAGTLTLNGSITATGADGMNASYPSGGGAGGTVNITAGTLTGNGTVQVNGGNGLTWGGPYGGSGAGGRIAIVANTADTFTGSYYMNPGNSVNQVGGTGTLAIKGPGTDSYLIQSSGTITPGNYTDLPAGYISSFTAAKSWPMLPSGTLTFSTITLNNGAVFTNNGTVAPLAPIILPSGSGITNNGVMTFDAIDMYGSAFYQAGTLNVSTVTMGDSAIFTLAKTTQQDIWKLTMLSGSTMTHAANSTVRSYVVNLNVGSDFSFQSGAAMNLNGKGYIGGAGNSSDASPGYGPAGSGGGGKTGSTSNAGGGGGHAGRGGVGGGPGGGAG